MCVGLEKQEDVVVKGRCELHQRAICNKSNVWKKSQRSHSIFIHNFGNSTRPALHQDTNLLKYKNLAAKPDHESATEPDLDGHTVSFRDGVVKKFNTFYKFCRVYGIVANILCVSSFSILPLKSMSDISLPFLVEMLKVLISVVLITIHLIGLNQVCDFELDKINKPYLPLPSGEMSLTTAKAIVAITGFMSIAIAWLMQSPPFLFVILAHFFLFGAYSLDYPFLRWKKNAFLAVLCIVTVKGLVSPIGMFMHIQKYVLRQPIAFTESFVFSVAMALIFSIVTGIFKDVPDLDGDKALGMENFTVLFGKEKIFSFCTNLVLLGYGAAVIKGAALTLLPMKLVTMLGHGGLACILLYRAKSVNLSDIASTSSFYSFLWKLHCAEYLLIHFIR